jgi:replicative DNA helicase
MLPHSLDAERALLGSMLLEEAAIGQAVASLHDAGDGLFWSQKHQKLYDHVVDLWKQRGPVDAIVIKDALDRENAFEQLGGYEYLAELISSVPSALRVSHYAEIVRNKFLLRRLIDAAHRVMIAAFESERPPVEVLELAEKEIFSVTERRVTTSADTLMPQIDELFRRIQDRRPLEGLPTGFHRLDEMTSGLHPSELIIIAGRPSMGKTALGLNIAEHMALDQRNPVPVLFFSLEMSREALAERILCGRGRVDAHKLRKARTDARELERLKEAAGQIEGKPLFVDDTPALTILELRARAQIVARKHNIQAIFVDYLQLMHVRGKESRQIEVAEISRGLKALAKDLRVPVIAMAQLNRNPEDRSRNRPRMSDLRESGAIEQDADVIMLLHRDSYYKDKTGSDSDESPGPDADDFKAELILDKQRNGPTGIVELHFDRHFTRFDNYDPTAAARFENVSEAEFGTDVVAPF